MRKALRKRIWRIIKENRGRYIGVFILIFLGSFAYAIMSGMGDNLSALVSGFAEDNRQEDIMFGTHEPISDLSAFEAGSGAFMDSYLYHDVLIPNGELRLLSPSSKVNIPAVTAGRNIERSGEILLNSFFCQTQGLSIGEQFEVGGKVFSIVGFASLPNYSYILKNVNDIMAESGFGIGIIKQEDFAFFEDAETVYTVRFASRENINAQTANLYNLLGVHGYSLSQWADATNNNRIQMPWASITGVQTMSAPAAVAMFLLCCLIVGLMIWRMLKADGVIIGTLYAQGYRRKELMQHYLTIPLVLSAAAGLGGTLLAIPCIKPTIDYMTMYYSVPVTAVALSPVKIILGLILPMIFMGVASYFVVRKILKKSAAELMKGDAQKAKINFIERRLRLKRFKFNTKFQLREQVRSIPRLLFLLLGISSASMMMLFGFTINNSMNIALNADLEGTYNFAWEYSFREVQNGQPPEGAEPFNAIRCYPDGRENVEFYIMGILPDSNNINLRAARNSVLPKDQVNITYPLASRLKLKIGDTIRFVNKLDGTVYSLSIEGIVDTYSEQFIYMPLDQFNQMIGVEADSYMGLFSNRELGIDPKMLSGVKDLQNVDNALGDLATTMTMMVVFATVLGGVIGAVIIFLVTSLMIEESRNTISMLKVFGYHKKEVARLILNSSTPMVIIGFCIGFPMMLITGNTMYAYLGEMINLVLPMVTNPLHVLVSFIIVFGVYWFTKMLCGKKLDKISMNEALKAGTE